jgi:hypothetical protein
LISQFSSKGALVDPVKCNEGDGDRAYFLDGRSPFPKWNEDNEGANQKRGLRDFDSNIEGN